ncbi:MAG: N(4)-(beta-N-acetylglucosaminyl)-L-asparaginase [Chloroflexi bacterium]|nr:N(4)-(beta-N-acetylglucosaminyl)-L-asparaginase [Chloroflexota bacterium]
MIVVASTNGIVGIDAAMRVLKAGGTAVDAVETGIRLVEANGDDHSVGYGGYPNLLGDVELDASIMDGATLAAGAVGALRNCVYAISVARKVMERLPHVFLVGEGAARFAREMGFDRVDLLTEEPQSVWENRLRRDLPAHVFEHLNQQPDLWRWVDVATDPEKAWGTVNFLAQDAEGQICAGASTSGWAWKYPGRLGDSPVIGAGVYADDRFGAAACTGTGEMAIRACTAHSIVFYLKMGIPLQDAGERAMRDLNDLGGAYLSDMNFIAIDRDGRHAGFMSGEVGAYLFMAEEMSAPEEAPRTRVELNKRWANRVQVQDAT